LGARRINHVSIVADDLEESARFYKEMFGMERVATARFPEGVLWLKVGEQQLHLFEVDGNEPTEKHHFGLDVEGFEAFYALAKERGVLDSKAWGTAFRGHPQGWVQVYLRDPAGNLVEVNWPDATTLDPAILAEMTPLESMARQEGDAAIATLYHSLPLDHSLPLALTVAV
jgi:catechol 2,3-dioxygenase-like lactoylglutathione lyase family enzyme